MLYSKSVASFVGTVSHSDQSREGSGKSVDIDSHADFNCSHIRQLRRSRLVRIGCRRPGGGRGSERRVRLHIVDELKSLTVVDDIISSRIRTGNQRLAE